jgi:hypothetical protein
MAFFLKKRLIQWFSYDQGNYREDNKDDNKPLSYCPCYLADKSKNHKYNRNYDEEYSKRQEPVHNLFPIRCLFTTFGFIICAESGLGKMIIKESGSLDDHEKRSGTKITASSLSDI